MSESVDADFEPITEKRLFRGPELDFAEIDKMPGKLSRSPPQSQPDSATPIYRIHLRDEFEIAAREHRDPFSETPTRSPWVTPRVNLPTPSRVDCNSNPFSQVRGGSVEVNLTELHLSELKVRDCDEPPRKTPRALLPHAAVAIHNQSVGSTTPFFTPTSAVVQTFPCEENLCTPHTAFHKVFDRVSGPEVLEMTASPRPLRFGRGSPTDSVDQVETTDTRFVFSQVDPVTALPSFVPLHLDANGIVWLARHCTDGLPYAVKEVKGNKNVELELACLTLGNVCRDNVSIQASQHISRYHTTVRHSFQPTTLIQTEYFVRGNVGESVDAHTNLAISAAAHQRRNGVSIDESCKWRIVKESLPPQSELLTMMQHVLLALQAVHHSKMVHGNAIVWNVFIATNYHYKLGNFGAASRASECEFAIEWLQPSLDDRWSFTPFEIEVFIFGMSVWEMIISGATKVRNFWLRSDVSPTRVPNNCTPFDPETFETLRVEGFHDYDSVVLDVVHAMLNRKSIESILAFLDAPSPRLFHIQCAYDREIMKVMAAIDHLKQRQSSLARKYKRDALDHGILQSHLNASESEEPVLKTRKVEGMSRETTPQSSPQLRPSMPRCGHICGLPIPPPRAPDLSASLATAVANFCAVPHRNTLPFPTQRSSSILPTTCDETRSLEHSLDTSLTFQENAASSTLHQYQYSVTLLFMSSCFGVPLPTKPTWE